MNMRKRYYPILFLIGVIALLWLYLFSGWDAFLINLLLINIVIYIIRKPILILIGFLFKKKALRIIIIGALNLIWAYFIFWLIFVISFDLFIAIITFVIVSISLTFKNIINNITAGAILLTSEQFEIGDLIQTNNIQGIVSNINLSYTELREFDGVKNIIPNSNVYGSSITKFTHTEYNLESFRKDAKTILRGKDYRSYIQKVRKIISSGVKITRYIKLVEFLGSITPDYLESSLNKIFTKYEPIFGLRPGYGIELTDFGRIKVYLYVVSNNTEKVLNNMDAFLRDIVYEVYYNDIYDGWYEYRQKLIELNPKNQV